MNKRQRKKATVTTGLLHHLRSSDDDDAWYAAHERLVSRIDDRGWRQHRGWHCLSSIMACGPWSSFLCAANDASRLADAARRSR